MTGWDSRTSRMLPRRMMSVLLGILGKKESVTADFTYTDCMAGEALKTSTENKRKFLNA